MHDQTSHEPHPPERAAVDGYVVAAAADDPGAPATNHTPSTPCPHESEVTVSGEDEWPWPVSWKALSVRVGVPSGPDWPPAGRRDPFGVVVLTDVVRVVARMPMSTGRVGDLFTGPAGSLDCRRPGPS